MPLINEGLTIFDVAIKLSLPTDKNQLYVDCPNCRGKRKLNINFNKNMFRCNKCGDKAIHTQGGPIDLYMLYMGITEYREAYKALEDDGFISKEPSERPKPVFQEVEEKLATLEERDATYRALLSLLNLHGRHKESLRARGLSEEQIIRNGYRSMPSDPKAVALKLAQLGCTLEYVPGFYRDDEGAWRMMNAGSGILIPQRNSTGKIQGFQIRLDQKKSDGPRYISFSSRDKKLGAPAHSYVHYRPGELGCSQIVLTEGALKADVVSALSGYSVLSVPGVNSQKYLPSAIKALLPRGVKKVLIAYDMDAETNEHVEKAKGRLIDTLNHTCTGCGLIVRPDRRQLIKDGTCPRCSKRLGLSHATLKWNAEFKGLDDYLLAKKEGKTS